MQFKEAKCIWLSTAQKSFAETSPKKENNLYASASALALPAPVVQWFSTPLSITSGS